jgi:hypothetical protein
MVSTMNRRKRIFTGSEQAERLLDRINRDLQEVTVDSERGLTEMRVRGRLYSRRQPPVCEEDRRRVLEAEQRELDALSDPNVTMYKQAGNIVVRQVEKDYTGVNIWYSALRDYLTSEALPRMMGGDTSVFHPDVQDAINAIAPNVMVDR